MKDLQVSIIIPLYNREQLIERCLDSIATQALSQDQYEVLVIDDCSTDRSVEIVENYTKIKNISIQTLPKNSGGASKPRNYGIELAKGRYTIFIDSDDLLSENALKIALDLALKGDLDMVVIPILFGPKRKPYTTLFEDYPDGIEKTYLSKDKDLGRLLFSNPGIIGRLYRTSLLQESGIRFSEQMSIYEDTLFSRFIFSVSETFGMVSIKKAHYYPEPATSMENLSLIKRTVDSCLPYLLESIRMCNEIPDTVISPDKKIRILNNSFCRDNIFNTLNQPDGHEALVEHLSLLLPYLEKKGIREKAKKLIRNVHCRALQKADIEFATQYFKQRQKIEPIANSFEHAWIWQDKTLVLNFKIEGYRFGIDILTGEEGAQSVVELVIRKNARGLPIDWSLLGIKKGHHIRLFHYSEGEALQVILDRILEPLNSLRSLILKV